MKVEKRIIYSLVVCSLVINQISMGAPSLSSASVSSVSSEPDVSLIADQSALESVVQKFEAGGPAPRSSQDAFHITGQSRFDGKRRDSLSELNLGLSQVQVIDFNRDIKILSTSEGLEFEMKFGKALLHHTLPQFRPVKWAMDKEILTFVNEDGVVFGIDIGLARTLVFNGPIPVFRVGAIPLDLLGSHFEMAFITRQMPIPNFDHPKAMIPLDRPGSLHQAGDLLIYSRDENSRVTRLALLDRGVLLTQISRDEALLAGLAFKTSLRDEHEPLLKAMVDLERETQAEGSSGKSEEHSDLVLDAFQNIGNKAILELLAQSRLNGSRSGDRPMDVFSTDEIRIQQERAPEVEVKAVPKSWFQRSLQLVRPVITPRSVIILAAALVGGHYALETPEATLALGWCTYMFNELYGQFVPEVLKDSAYRITLLKSSISLAAFVPLMLGIGYVYNSFMKTSGLAIRGIAAMSFRVYGALSFPFWHRVIGVLHQEGFLTALREGVNPLRKINPDSYLGKKVGLTQPQRIGIAPWGPNRPQVQEQAGKMLSEISRNKAKLKSLSWQIAMVVASEESHIDPATLSLSVSENGMESVLEKLAQDPELQKRWSQLAREFHLTLLKMKKGLLTEDLSHISKTEVQEMYLKAVEISRQIDRRSKIASFAQNLNLKFHELLASASRNASQFGVAEYEFLRLAKPDDFVANTMWRQFVTDYLLSVVQIGLVGDRANLEKPHDLAAKEDGFLWTSAGHRYDMLDQVQIYGIVLAARLGLVYQKAATYRETAYDPIEDSSLTGSNRTEGFMRGLLRYSKHALNLREAKYSDVLLRDLVKRVKTIQAGFLMSVVGRMVFGGQAIGQAALAFVFTVIWGEWAYGWTWKPLRQGSQGTENDFATSEATLRDAKTVLGRGLRLNDPIGISDGYQRLAKLYADAPNNDLPPEIVRLVENAAQITDPNSMLWTQSGITQLDPVQLARLQQAIIQGDHAELVDTQSEISSQYGLTGDPKNKGKNLEALELMIYSLKNPPYATKANNGVEWFTTLLGAVGSTYLATSMMVGTFQDNISWGEKIGEAALMSAGLYATAFMGQKAIEKSFAKYDEFKARRAAKIEAAKDQTAINQTKFGIVNRRSAAVMCSQLL